MATATERIPILVTKADKAKFSRKAKASGLSISEFARTAMDRYDPADEDEHEALGRMLEHIKQGTAEAEKALGEAIDYCSASEARLRELEAWLETEGHML
jgi:hypothetical protein